MTPSETARVLGILRGAYPRQKVPRETLEAYAVGLKDLPAPKVFSALEKILATRKWFPTISEIREIVFAESLSLATEEEALDEVRAALRRWGANEKPEWSSPEISRAVRAVGWANWCMSEHPASTRARFLDAYRNVCAQRTERAQSEGLALPGSENQSELGDTAAKLLAGVLSGARPHVDGDGLSTGTQGRSEATPADMTQETSGGSEPLRASQGSPKKSPGTTA